MKIALRCFRLMLDEAANGLGSAPDDGDIIANLLGQRCRGSVPLPGVAGGLCWNMVIAVVEASLRMAWISLAKPTIDDATQ